MSVYKTIKCSLKTIIKNTDEHQTINNLVLKCHDIVTDTYNFIRLYCLEVFHQKKDLPTLDTKFITCAIKTLCYKNAKNGGRKTKDNTLIKH